MGERARPQQKQNTALGRRKATQRWQQNSRKIFGNVVKDKWYFSPSHGKS
jgi:hypothetical protein